MFAATALRAWHWSPLLGIALALCLLSPHIHLRAAEPPPPLPERTALAVQVLSRMDPATLAGNDRLQATLQSVLGQTRGQPEFVQLVTQFSLTNQNAELLRMATDQPDAEHGVQAMKLLLAQESGNDAVRKALAPGDAEAASPSLIRALGNTGEQRIVPLLAPFITSTNAPLPRRKAAVQALARNREGVETLLKAAADQSLPADIQFTTATALASIRWNDLRTRAAELLPPPQGQNAQPLPPLEELMKQQGDAQRGAAVFARETSQCIQCHKVGDQGIDVGPNLSEIGGKLGKDALYEAILAPSAGIAFNYEAWEITLKSGDDAFGLLVSETPDELAIKDTRGLVTRHAKSNVESRRQMTLSLMPADLQLAMSTQDLVDLVEFLASLKKP